MRRARILLVTAVVLGWAAMASAVDADVTAVRAVDDTYIQSGQPGWSDSCYGRRSGMSVGQGRSSGAAWGLVRFDLSPIPDGAVVEYARLELWLWRCIHTLQEVCPDKDISVHRLEKWWGEETATWDSMGAASSTKEYARQTVEGCDGIGRWVYWDVTALVREWHAGTYPNYGLALHGHQPVGWPEYACSLGAKEGGGDRPPRLSVAWSLPPTATPEPTASPTPTATPSLAPTRLVVLPLVLRGP